MQVKLNGQSAFVYTGTKALRPGDPTTVFVHGAGQDHTVWQLQSRYFANHGHNVVALDLPNHGKSEGPARETIGELAHWVNELTESLALGDHYHLVGHSMGALVALEAAAAAGPRVSKLCLLGACAPMVVHDLLLNAARNDLSLAHDLIALWAHSQRAHLGGHRAPGMWMTGSAIRLLEHAKPGQLHMDLSACNNYQDAFDQARKIQCQVWFLVGSHDRMTPPKFTHKLAGAFERAELVEIPDCGHMMMSERPNQTLNALVRALGIEGED